MLVTSALPYVNNVPHLGNIIGCVLSADVYARFARARGYNVIYVCGTDEYGTATETKAHEEGLTCQEICDKYHAIHKSIYEWFGIQFDKFGRTTTPEQTEVAQGIFLDLLGQGMLEEKTTEQLYSDALAKFLADRLVEGTCPKCPYSDARGDQCDQCGALLSPTDLINPRCKLTGTTPRLRETTHMYLNMPALADRHEQYVERTSKEGGWSANCVRTTKAWIRDGLQSRCITRDLKWGTPVPMEKFKEKVFYVWFDAPIGYISITATYTPEWRQWWEAREEHNVELIQFMGKDNIPFHSIIFPCTLMGTGKPWTLMKNISVTEYLNYEGDKFSKSRGRGVFGDNARETGIPAEVWRYYLLAVRPETADTDFKWADLAAKCNNELLKNLGNFINRVMSFTNSRFASQVPEATEDGQAESVALGKEVAQLVRTYVENMEKQNIRSGLQGLMAASSCGNLFLQENAPWVLFKENPGRCGTILAACLGLVRILAALAQPFMPSLTDKILDQLNLGVEEACMLDDASVASFEEPHRLLATGHKIKKAYTLFTAIPDSLVEELRERFSGAQQVEGEPGQSAPEKKKKKKKGGGGGQKAPAEDTSNKPLDVSRLNVRVGVVQKAWVHPDADSLYVEEIDLGEEEGPRTVVSGLVKHMSLEDLQGARVLCVANMKPSKMRGVQSQAMVLAATGPDGKVELVTPPEGSAVGERVTFEGYDGEPDLQLNPKKKIFEAIQPDFATRGDCVAEWKGVAFTTSGGVCRVATVAGGTIR